jgi:hypothetical protein
MRIFYIFLHIKTDLSDGLHNNDSRMRMLRYVKGYY